MSAGKQSLKEHPTGITTVVATAGFLLVEKFTSVDFTTEEIAVLIAAVAGIVSIFTPRKRVARRR